MMLTVLDSVHHDNKFIKPDQSGWETSINEGYEERRASSCFDLKQNAFYIRRFQIIAPVSEIPNRIMNIYRDACMPRFIRVPSQNWIIWNDNHLVTDVIDSDTPKCVKCLTDERIHSHPPLCSPSGKYSRAQLKGLWDTTRSLFWCQIQKNKTGSVYINS